MEIIDFRPDLALAFKVINEAWISRFFKVEPKDRVVLDNPRREIIERGGKILFCLDNDRTVGCVALMKLPDGGFEVAKMAVAEPHKGKGYGKALMQACIDRARAAGAPRLYLETNSTLGPAMALYRAFGFTDLEGRTRKPGDYARVDTWMELKL